MRTHHAWQTGDDARVSWRNCWPASAADQLVKLKANMRADRGQWFKPGFNAPGA